MDERYSLVDLGNLMVEHHWRLRYDLATGCKCLSCYSFQFVELADTIYEPDKIVHEGDTVEELVRVAHSACEPRG
jgi:hypothetical protein